ncbi:NADH-cytochrome b5 reductase 3 [Portunus trituberculatus]|uniref:NADH-cytochrome b5 reductase 3 n=1 Tax=Portunus trituberculatus TaxID=210409 RepID=A0A5B7DBX8_PORTR|nr:NADH-cytochrome b5 reductase 3 [Portunus trituberculatus]
MNVSRLVVWMCEDRRTPAAQQTPTTTTAVVQREIRLRIAHILPLNTCRCRPRRATTTTTSKDSARPSRTGGVGGGRGDQDSRLQMVYTLGKVPEEWEGEEGFIDTNMINTHVTKPNGINHKIVMCGGPAMVLSSLYSLRTLGYTSECVFVYGQFGIEQVKTVYGKNINLSSHRCDNLVALLPKLVVVVVVVTCLLTSASFGD